MNHWPISHQLHWDLIPGCQINLEFFLPTLQTEKTILQSQIQKIIIPELSISNSKFTAVYVKKNWSFSFITLNRGRKKVNVSTKISYVDWKNIHIFKLLPPVWTDIPRIKDLLHSHHVISTDNPHFDSCCCDSFFFLIFKSCWRNKSFLFSLTQLLCKSHSL